MRRVPSLEIPSPEQVFECGDRIPCFEIAKDIIIAETEKNNKILLLGDKACHPSETVVVIDFAEEPKNEYADLRKGGYNDIHQYLLFGDNKGALEIHFGRINEDRFNKR